MIREQQMIQQKGSGFFGHYNQDVCKKKQGNANLDCFNVYTFKDHFQVSVKKTKKEGSFSNEKKKKKKKSPPLGYQPNLAGARLVNKNMKDYRCYFCLFLMGQSFKNTFFFPRNDS